MKSLGNHVNECACCTSRDTACSLFTLPCTAGDGHHANSERAARAHVGRASGWPPRCMLHTPPAHAACTRRLHTPSPTAPLLSSPVKQTISHVRRHRCNSTPSLPQHAPPSSQSAPSSAAAAAGQRKAAGAGVGLMAAAGKAAGAGAGQMAAAAGPRVKDDKARQPQ